MTCAESGAPSANAAVRSAWRRAGASAYGCDGVRGAATRVALNNAPAGADAVSGEPAALSSAPKLWNAGESNTLETVWRSEPSCWGLESCGAVLSLHAPTTSAAAATAHHVPRCGDMLRPPGVTGKSLGRTKYRRATARTVTRRTRRASRGDALAETRVR